MLGVTSYTYDPRGLLLSVTNPLSQITSYTYDDAKQQLTMTDGRNNTTTYGYDAAGRQTTITDALSGVVTFTYDLAGQPTALTNARGKTTTFTYDALGNMLTETDPLNNLRAWTYDLAGQMTSYTDGRGITQAYAYDDAGRKTAITYPGGSVAFGYDDLGRQTSMVDATGTTTRTYDAASRVTSVAAPQGTVSYAYNLAGQRTAMSLPGSRVVTYGYDSGGRLDTLTDWLSNVTTFTYDDNSRRTAIVRPNGITSGYAYDAASQVTAITHTGPSDTLMSFAYTYDAAGNRTSVVKDGGNPESYTLDALNRLTGVTYADGTTQSYTYDANGNRLSLTVNGGTPTTYTYTDADQLLSDGTSTYTYDANGNVVARGGDTFTWDYASRMTGATVNGVSASYTYDGEDVRVGKSVSGEQTSYVWDRQSGLPHLLDDGASAYLHANGVLGEITDSTREDLITDALGSVRGVSDDTGAATSTADYDAFGALRASAGSTAGFGFTGEESDPETGLTYLRARYLDPTLGRFTAADTVIPNAAGTQGFNPYAYAAGNPTTWTDPSGHDVASRYIPSAGAATGLARLGEAIAGGIYLLADFMLVTEAATTLMNNTDAECVLFNRNCPAPPPCVLTGSCGDNPNNGGDEGGGSGNGGGGGGAGGSTGPFPPNGFPPGDRNTGAACEAIVDVLSVGTAWVKTYANPAGDVVRFTSPDGKWEMELELKPSKNTTTLTGPRFRIRELAQGTKAIQQPYIDPWTGERGIRRSSIAHIPLLGDMASCAAKISTLFM